MNVLAQDVQVDNLNFNSGATRYINGPGGTNPLLIRNSSNSTLNLYGGTGSNGAYMVLRGNLYNGSGSSENGEFVLVSNTSGTHNSAGSIKFMQYDGTSWNNRYRIFKNGDQHWYTGASIERMTLLDNGNVGIGTINPDAMLHISSGNIGVKSQYAYGIFEAIDAQLDITSSSDGTWGSTINFIEGNGASNTDVWSISRQTTNGNGNSSLRINYGTTNNHINPNVITFNANGNVGIGTTNPTYKLAVKGTVGCGEVIVEDVTGWADFVFEDDYNLMSLKDLDQFIQVNKHLPEIPTTAEVEENGISVGEMNAKLLQKIEELTLYVIEQNKEMEKFKDELSQLKIENENLKSKFLDIND